MIISNHKLIYLHVPKTGGNALQTRLLAISDDKKKIEAHHDGINRFEINGPMTPRKHTTLAAYHKSLGPNLTDWKVMITIRHPFERAVSLYFSPHRWTKQNKQGRWYIHDPIWDEAQFLNMLNPAPDKECLPIVDFLRVGQHIHRPDIVLRYTHLQSDFDSAVKQHGLPTFPTLPHVNKSAANQNLRQRVLDSTRLRDHVERIFHEDMDYFSFAPT